MQVADGEFQNIGLLQLGHTGLAVFGGQSAGHQIFELVQAPVDPGAALSFQQWLCNLFEKEDKPLDKLYFCDATETSANYLFVLDGARDWGLTGEIESHNWSHFVFV